MLIWKILEGVDLGKDQEFSSDYIKFDIHSIPQCSYQIGNCTYVSGFQERGSGWNSKMGTYQHINGI